MTMTRSILSCG